MKLYKLTNQENETFNQTKWGENVSHETDGTGGLCGSGWLHAYTHPLLAVMLNPIHGNFINPKLWECEGEIGLNDRGLKVGCKKLTTTKEIPLPNITLEQKVRFAILCGKQTCRNKKWNEWADKWLNGKDRRKKAAANAAANSAANAAFYTAAAAANAAANAAFYAAAAYAADAYAADADADYAADAADAAADADASAAYAARKQSQQATAEICRKYIPLDLILSGIKSQEKQKA